MSWHVINQTILILKRVIVFKHDATSQLENEISLPTQYFNNIAKCFHIFGEDKRFFTFVSLAKLEKAIYLLEKKFGNKHRDLAI